MGDDEVVTIVSRERMGEIKGGMVKATKENSRV